MSRFIREFANFAKGNPRQSADRQSPSRTADIGDTTSRNCNSSLWSPAALGQDSQVTRFELVTFSP